MFPRSVESPRAEVVERPGPKLVSPDRDGEASLLSAHMHTGGLGASTGPAEDTIRSTRQVFREALLLQMWKLSLKEAPEVTQGHAPRPWMWVRTTPACGSRPITPNSRCFRDVRQRRGREDDRNAAQRAPVTPEK